MSMGLGWVGWLFVFSLLSGYVCGPDADTGLFVIFFSFKISSLFKIFNV